MKRLFILLLMTISLVFIGAQSTPTTNAMGSCQYVCGSPFIDPEDGHCYQVCCPQGSGCGLPCVVRPCH
jgi:hypothetical protein